ncbi:MAG: preprotein translocase subunit SecG [Pseudomonadota bacterium]|nr:preprotein translocase subunit SecG [Pseudomonadota bacterium]MEC8467002.1 preprotein translocase subunit SecG [Pseudomonadota bacterium]
MLLANILLFFNITVAVLLVILILLQRASSGLGALGGGGSGAAFSAASTGNALSKATTILAALFLGSCLWLAVEMGGKGRETGVVDTLAVMDEGLAVDSAAEEAVAPTVPVELPSTKQGANGAQ